MKVQFSPGAVAVSLSSMATRISGRRILRDIDLTLPAGRWTSIVGPNGAGKSTLLRVLAGLLPTEGEVRLLGRPAAQWPRRERAVHLAWLGQGEPGGEDLTAYDVALLGRLPHRGWLAPPSPEDHAAVARALHATQVWELSERRIGDLSGGERQRVLLARALAVEAPILLMDEPLAHLDPPHQADWMTIVRELVAAGGTVVSVLHELSAALQADDLLIVQEGSIVHHGPCADPLTHAALRAAFDDRIAIHALQEGWVALPRTSRKKDPHAD